MKVHLNNQKYQLLLSKMYKISFDNSKNTLSRIAVLESSSLDFRLIGAIFYDVAPLIDTNLCIIALSECIYIINIIQSIP